MVRPHRLLWVVALIGSVALVGTALAEKKHHAGHELLGKKTHQNGKHELHKVGAHTVSAHVSKGKITGVTVEHRTKGAVPVKKYKTDKKVVQANSRYLVMADTGTMTDATLAQLQYVTVWVGYAFYDEYGDEYIYWFPVALIYDGDTGAVLYVG
jgi:hypothetical protein